MNRFKLSACGRALVFVTTTLAITGCNDLSLANKSGGSTVQTIDFATIATQTVGANLQLSATATSGLTVSFASETSSICTVSGSTATMVAAGTCTIQATQAGNATYAAATPISQSFTVSGSLTSQTIAFANPGSQIVGTPLTLVATASSGLTVTFTSQTTSVCTVSNTTATFVATGTCTIQATQPGNSTYAAATPVTQSFAVNAVSLSQTITFANPGTQRVGVPLTLSATASSGLTVTFTSQTLGICIVNGTTATMIAAGTCTIQATQPGNSTYAAATPVTQSFTSKGAHVSQTITFANPGTQHVGTPLTLVATATSGLPVSFASQTTSVCTVSGTTATFLATGTCTVQATQAGNATYAAATPVTRSFSVVGGTTPQTITFANPGTQAVGTPLTLLATASSGLPLSFTSLTSTVCTLSGTTATFHAAGTCTIQASQAGNATYAAATPVVQSFSVTGSLLSQTITFANPGSQNLGTPLTLLATASSGLPVSFASQTNGVCTVSGTTATFVTTGTCTIQASQAGNATYAAAVPVTQSFTVGGSLLSQTITFNNPGAQTGGAPLTLVATASSGLTVAFASETTNVCSASGTTATFLTNGTCTIQATQAGNTTYAAATPVAQSFSVTGVSNSSSNAVAYSSCPAPAGSGVQYTIGLTGTGPQTIAAFTQWNNLNPGDVVCIYGKSTPYAERLVLTRSGSDEQHRIRIVGVIQNGYEPILTGKSATTAAAFNYGSPFSQYYALGEVSISGLDYGAPVTYVNVEGLTIQGATTAEVGGTVASPTFSPNTFSDPNINGGAQSPWSCSAEGIYIIRSDHISIIHNRIKDNDDGIFVSSNNGNTSSNVLIAYNHIYGNGLTGDSINSCPFDGHNTYTEAENITYIGNRFGPTKTGQAVNLLKDRSSGLVVEYNLFQPNGQFEQSLGDSLLVGSTPGAIGHILDLVESYDSSVGLNSLGAVYQNVSVFGNIFFDDGNAADGSQGTEDAIHFGGDAGNPAVFRKYLHFYNNTVVTRRLDGVGWLEMEDTTTGEAWNNIFYAAFTGSGADPGFDLISTWCYDKQYGATCGTVNYLTENWNSPIWGTTGVNGANPTPSFVNLANNDVHISTNDPTIVGNGQTGDSSYPANSTTIPIEYQDFLTTVPRPYSQTSIDLGALGYVAP